jgi:hypothetical protein
MPLPSSPSMPHDAAGNLNLTAHFEAGLGGTTGDVLPSAYTVDPATGASYMFQLHPLVESVAPAAGALQGAPSGPVFAEHLRACCAPAVRLLCACCAPAVRLLCACCAPAVHLLYA